MTLELSGTKNIKWCGGHHFYYFSLIYIYYYFTLHYIYIKQYII